MKGLKTGGRVKGTPNKRSTGIAIFLENRGLNLAEEAAELYREATDNEFKLKILTLLMPYVYAKKAEPPDDPEDITPMEQLDLDEMKRLYISGSQGLQDLKSKIEEKERGQS